MVRMNVHWIGLRHYVHAARQRTVGGGARQQMIGRSCRIDQRLQVIPVGAGVGLRNVAMSGFSATCFHIREVELISGGVEQQPCLVERPVGMCVRDRRTVCAAAEARRRIERGCVQRELGRQLNGLRSGPVCARICASGVIVTVGSPVRRRRSGAVVLLASSTGLSRRHELARERN